MLLIYMSGLLFQLWLLILYRAYALQWYPYIAILNGVSISSQELERHRVNQLSPPINLGRRQYRTFTVHSVCKYKEIEHWKTRTDPYIGEDCVDAHTWMDILFQNYSVFK